jgi:hypothetical protein
MQKRVANLSEGRAPRFENSRYVIYQTIKCSVNLIRPSFIVSV